MQVCLEKGEAGSNVAGQGNLDNWARPQGYTHSTCIPNARPGNVQKCVSDRAVIYLFWTG